MNVLYVLFWPFSEAQAKKEHARKQSSSGVTEKAALKTAKPLFDLTSRVEIEFLYLCNHRET